jgi:hypothetical protein
MQQIFECYKIYENFLAHMVSKPSTQQKAFADVSRVQMLHGACFTFSRKEPREAFGRRRQEKGKLFKKTSEQQLTNRGASYYINGTGRYEL